MGQTYDVVIVGSGAAALTAALRIRSQGLRPLVIEKTAFVGGSSGLSGGGLWVPNSGVHKTDFNDSKAKALEYMSHIIPKDAGRAASIQRQNAFLDNGPEMVGFLKDQGFQWAPSIGYPDYNSDLPGGMPDGGRSIESDLFNTNLLGTWKDKVIVSFLRLPMYSYELRHAVRAGRTWESLSTLLKLTLWRGAASKIIGKDYVGLGQSLVAQLLYLNLEVKNDIWLETPMKELLTSDDGRVTGIAVERNGGEVQIETSKGVLLAAGGFSQNTTMRKQHQGDAITSEWTSTHVADTGDAIVAAQKVGAHLEGLYKAWWGPTLINPKTKERIWEMTSRCCPHTIIVDSGGRRIANEAVGYVAFGEAQIARHKTQPAIPAVMIMDSRHRSQYMLGKALPGFSSQALEDGLLFKADSLRELAAIMEIAPDGLEEQVKRFNQDVTNGKDSQFHRGDTAFDRFFGDSRYPNPSLGSIEQAPFYAALVYPGDLGTSGGILTDEVSRALKDDGSVIPGLYATGNCSASVMGGAYPGSGATLGPALTFAYIAANHIVSSL